MSTTAQRKTSVDNSSQRKISQGKVDPPTGNDPQKNTVLEIITEFIESGDLNEALEDIKKRVEIDGAEFVKRSLIFGIEHKSYERELISQLLSSAYSIFQSEMMHGFTLLLNRLPDLLLDVPDAVDVLGKFIARAIVDEILPPVFLTTNTGNDKGLMALSLASELYEKERKRMEHIWGPGDLSSVARLRKEVDSLLIEYLENKDINDATHALNALGARSFNSQVIRQCLTLALERNNPTSREDLLNLIISFNKSGVVLPYDVRHGFELTWRKIQDIKLDVPNAQEMLALLTSKAIQANLLPSDFSYKS